MIYLVGSLRNEKIPHIAEAMRDCGLDVFDSWYSAGKDADDYWQAHEQLKGHGYIEALNGAHATNVFLFDRDHLMRAEAAVLVAPAGKSAHLELGWMLGRGKPGYILIEEEPERFDVMARFATGVFDDLDALIKELM